jgi:hypothetical protein
MLRDKQAAAHQQAGQRNAHREHPQTRFEAYAVRGPCLSGAATRSMNAYASITRCLV